MKEQLKYFLAVAMTSAIIGVSYADTLPPPTWTWDGADGTAIIGELAPNGAQAYTVNGKIVDLSEKSIPAKNFTISFWTKDNGGDWKNYTGFSDSTKGIQFQRRGTAEAFSFYTRGDGITVYKEIDGMWTDQSANEDDPNEAIDGVNLGNTLTLLTIVQDSGMLTLYKNGEEMGKRKVEGWDSLTSTATPAPTMTYFGLGCAPAANGGADDRTYNTTIADYRIYSFALTKEQIEAIANEEPPFITREIDADANWSSTAAWSDGSAAPGTDAKVQVTASATATLTMNASADLTLLEVVESDAVLTIGPQTGDEATANTLTTDVLVVNGSLVLADPNATLGTVSVASGKTLEIAAVPAATIDVSTAQVQGGKYKISCGSESAPVKLELNNDSVNVGFGELEVGTGNAVELYFNNNRFIKATGASADDSTVTFIAQANLGWVGSDSAVKNATLKIKSDNSTVRDFWNQGSNNLTDGTVDLDIDSTINFFPQQAIVVRNLTGSGAILNKQNGAVSVTVKPSGECTYSGVNSDAEMIVGDDDTTKTYGTLILAGENTTTKTLTIKSNAKAKITGKWAGQIVVDGTLEIASTAMSDVTGTITGAGTIKITGSGSVTLPNASGFTGTWDIADNVKLVVDMDGATTKTLNGTGLTPANVTLNNVAANALYVSITPTQIITGTTLTMGDGVWVQKEANKQTYGWGKKTASGYEAVTLADLKKMAYVGTMDGGSVDKEGETAYGYCISESNNTLEVQMQIKDADANGENQFTKCVFVELVPDTANGLVEVYASKRRRGVHADYGKDLSGKSGDTIIATSEEEDGYGIHDLTLKPALKATVAGNAEWDAINWEVDTATDAIGGGYSLSGSGKVTVSSDLATTYNGPNIPLNIGDNTTVEFAAVTLTGDNPANAWPNLSTITVAEKGVLELKSGSSYVKITGTGLTKVTGIYNYGIDGGNSANTAINTKLTVDKDAELWFIPWAGLEIAVPELTVNGKIATGGKDYAGAGGGGATGTVTFVVKDGKVLQGAGQILVPVTLEAGAKLVVPATGCLTLSGLPTLPESGTVTIEVPAGTANGTEVLKFASETEVTDAELAKFSLSGVTGTKLVATATALVLEADVTIVKPNGITEWSSETAEAALEAAAIAAGLTGEVAVTGTSAGDDDLGAAVIDSALALFSGDGLIQRKDNENTLVVGYNFGITGITVNRNATTGAPETVTVTVEAQDLDEGALKMLAKPKLIDTADTTWTKDNGETANEGQTYTFEIDLSDLPGRQLKAKLSNE